MTRRRWSRSVIVAVVAAAAGYGLLQSGRLAVPDPVARGVPAPAFAATTLDLVPQVRTLESYRGAPIILNVWATWCDPCREEMPSLQRLYEARRDRGLRIVAVSVDDRGSEHLLREFAAEHRLTFDILHDEASAILRSYQVRGVPQTYLIDRAGPIVAMRFVEDWSAPANVRLVDSLLIRPR